jgi:fused signal recognition particle receptor
MTSNEDEVQKPKPGLRRRLFSRDEPAAAPPAAAEEPVRRSWLSRLRSGLSRSSASIGQGIADIFTKRKLDAAALDDLEDVLIQADLGLAAATRIREAVGRGRYDKAIDPEEVRGVLAAEVERALSPVARPLAIEAGKRPFVILVVGVNGSGKTTTIGKLAAKFSSQGLNVTLAAGDTFRAAAIEQLKLWGERLKVEVVASAYGADPASVAHDAVAAAQARKTNYLFIDTAGRLHTKHNLMQELQKLHRVIGKQLSGAPHEVLLVLDATTGMNALNQAREFNKAVPLTGLIVTKLDGTSKGGMVVAIQKELGLPIKFVGLGEQADDLQPFDAKQFAAALFAE